MEINYDMDYVVRVKKEKLEIKPTLNKTLKYDIFKFIIFLFAGILGVIIFNKIRRTDIQNGFSGNLYLDNIRLSSFMILGSFVLLILDLSDRWNLKIENGYIYIKQVFKEYKIDLKELINIEKKQHSFRSRHSGRSISQYIIITYMKDNKIKEKRLQYRVINSIGINKIEQHISDEDIFKVFEHFITKSQLEKNLILENSNYIEIRNNSENIDLEEKIKTIMGKLDKADKIYVSIMLSIFIVIMLVIIIGPWLVK